MEVPDDDTTVGGAEIPQHDVLLSCHYNHRALANQVYDRVVCPERTLKLDLKIVKKEIREALLNTDEFVHAYGDGVDVPEPKFWIPAAHVEMEGQRWKGKPGTRRTVIVGKRMQQMDVYEASDAYVIKENHGNSNRGKEQGKKRRKTEPLQEPYLTIDDLPTETESFEDSFCFIGVSLEGAVECGIAAAVEWASDDHIKRICVAGFQEDIRKIREWHLTTELYTGLHEEIQAEHNRQLERRLIDMVEGCYRDMVNRSRIPSSAAAAA